jgi:hypothetical protein
MNSPQNDYDSLIKRPAAALRCISRCCNVHEKVRFTPRDWRALPAAFLLGHLKIKNYITFYELINFYRIK